MSRFQDGVDYLDTLAHIRIMSRDVVQPGSKVQTFATTFSTLLLEPSIHPVRTVRPSLHSLQPICTKHCLESNLPSF